jgi:predicted RNA-binding protein with TRAM domain
MFMGNQYPEYERMVEIPETLRCLVTATLEQRDGRLLLDIPDEVLTRETVDAGTTYRVAVLTQPTTEPPQQPPAPSHSHSQSPDRNDRTDAHTQEPPVEEGEIRDVTIEAIGDQGDGIAKVERGYVLIVAGTHPGQDVTVEIEEVRANVAFAGVIEDGS